MNRKNAAAIWILIAMLVGIGIGYMIYSRFPDRKLATEIAGYISLVSHVFLRLIKLASRTWGTRPRSGACSRKRSGGSSPLRWSRCSSAF